MANDKLDATIVLKLDDSNIGQEAKAASNKINGKLRIKPKTDGMKAARTELVQFRDDLKELKEKIVDISKTKFSFNDLTDKFNQEKDIIEELNKKIKQHSIALKTAPEKGAGSRSSYEQKLREENALLDAAKIRQEKILELRNKADSENKDKKSVWGLDLSKATDLMSQLESETKRAEAAAESYAKANENAVMALKEATNQQKQLAKDSEKHEVPEQGNIEQYKAEANIANSLANELDKAKQNKEALHDVPEADMSKEVKGIQNIANNYEKAAEAKQQLSAEPLNLNADVAKMNIAELMRYMQQLKDRQKEIEAAGMPAERDTEYNQITDQLTRASRAATEYKRNLDKIVNTPMEKPKLELMDMNKALSILKKAGNVATKMLQSGFKKLGNVLSSVKSSLNKMHSQMQRNFKHNFTNLVKYVLGFRSLFFLVRRLRKYLKEGIDNLAQWHGGNNRVNKEITQLKTSLLYLQNAWAAAFSPILEVAIGPLTDLIDALAVAGNAVARFLATLFGQDKVYQALKVNAQDYANSLDNSSSSAKKAKDATDDLKKSLADYDKLLVIKQDKDKDNSSSPSGGGGSDWLKDHVNDMFKDIEAGDGLAGAFLAAFDDGGWSKVGETIGTKLAEQLDNIPWNSLQEKVKTGATNLANFLNGFLGNTKLWDSAGTAAGEAFNTMAIGLKSFLEPLDTFKIGWNASSGLRHFLTTVNWEDLGKTIKLAWDKINEGLQGFLDNFPSKETTDAILNFLKGLNLPDAIATGLTTIAKALNTFADVLKGVSSGIDGFNTGWKLSNGFKQFLLEVDWKNLGSSIKSAWDTITQGIDGFLKAFPTETTAKAIMDFISGLDLPDVIATTIKLSGTFLATAIQLASDTIVAGADALANRWVLDVSTARITKYTKITDDGTVHSVELPIEPTVDWTEHPILALLFSGSDYVADIMVNIMTGGDFDRLQELMNNWPEEISFEGLGKALASVDLGTWKTIGNVFGLLTAGIPSASVIEGLKNITDAFKQGNLKGLSDLADIIGLLTAGMPVGSIIAYLFDWTHEDLENGTAVSDIKIMMNDIAKRLQQKGKAWNVYNVGAEFGLMVLEGFKEGLLAGVKGIGEWGAKNIINPIVKFFTGKDAFDIQSPSKKAKYWGEMIVEGFKEGVSGLWNKVKEFFDPTSPNSIFAKIKGVFSIKNFNDIKSKLSEGWGKVTEIFSNTWSNISKFFSVSNPESIWYKLKEKFSTDYIKKNVIDKIKDNWGQIKDVFSGTWSKISEFFSVSNTNSIWYKIKSKFTKDYIKTNIIDKIKENWGSIKDVFSGTWGKIKEFFEQSNENSIWAKIRSKFTKDYITKNVVDKIKGGWDSITSVFSGTWGKIKKYFSEDGNDSIIKKVRDSFLGVWGSDNGEMTYIGGFVGGILKSLRKLRDNLKKPFQAIIDYFYNNFIYKIVDAINWLQGKLTFSIGGKSYTIGGLNPIKYPTIPKLAQGAVIPPNREFLAVLGDQKKGTNIETPLDTMIDAFKIALAEGGSTNHEPIVLQLDGRVVAKTVWDEEAKKYKQTGFGLAY